MQYQILQIFGTTFLTLFPHLVVLDISKMEASGIELNPIPFSIVQRTEDMLEIIGTAENLFPRKIQKFESFKKKSKNGIFLIFLRSFLPSLVFLTKLFALVTENFSKKFKKVKMFFVCHFSDLFDTFFFFLYW